MLSYKLLKNHAGLILTGDYQTLKALHQVIHEVNDRSPIIKHKDSGFFLGLAYDVRKAHEGQRVKLASPEGYPEIGPRFGAEILWPVILWQSRVLRESLAYMDSDKEMQAHAYALEAVIEYALKADFGEEVGAQAIYEWSRLDPDGDSSDAVLRTRGGVFSSWTKAKRKAGIVGMIASFSPMYKSFYPIWVRNGDKHLVPPAEFEQWAEAEWPDPKW